MVGDELRAVNAERVAPDRHDVRHRAACEHAAIKGYDRDLLASLLDCRGESGRGVGRHDQDVATLPGQHRVDVRNLLVVFALSIGDNELRDVLFVQVNFGLHGGPPHHAPRVADTSVREADAIWPWLLVLGRVDRLAADILLPRLAGRTLRGHFHELPLMRELFWIIKALRDSRSRG